MTTSSAPAGAAGTSSWPTPRRGAAAEPFRLGGLRHRIEYLVDARRYYPVFMRWVRLGKRERVLAETRYLTYERLPFDAEHRKLLKLEPHPGARVIPLPQP